MRELVNRFLDNYCSEEITCVKDKFANQYYLMSGDVIVLRVIKLYNGKEDVLLYRQTKVYEAIQSMFGITDKQSGHYIMFWLKDRLGEDKIRGLLKLIPQ